MSATIRPIPQIHMRAFGDKRSSGFTLIELLAVMTILAILSAAFIVGFRKFQRAGEEEETRTRIRQMAALISGEYEIAKGDYPPMTSRASAPAPRTISTWAPRAS